MAEYRIEKGPAYSVLRVVLEPGESVVVESGSYLLNRGEVDVKTTTGGIVKALLRAIAGGESLFLNVITAKERAEVWIAPPVTGDIAAIDIDGEIFIQDSSYLAHIGDIEVSVGWRGLSGLLAEGELIWVKARGRGTVFLSSFGAIMEVEVPPGEKVTVDNGHFVAIEGGSWKIRKFGGWKTFFLGGEGLVVDVYGPARLWVQTRNLPAFAGVLRRFLPTSRG
jgi:uncharacterized protein (TIGR00266 family)